MEKDINKYVEEFLTSHGRRELSLEQMGQVVGGLSLFHQEIRTEEDIEAVCGVAAYLEQIYGTRDIVAEWIMQETKDNTMMNEYRAFGVDGLYQRLYNIVIRGHKY